MAGALRTRGWRENPDAVGTKRSAIGGSGAQGDASKERGIAGSRVRRFWGSGRAGARAMSSRGSGVEVRAHENPGANIAAQSSPALLISCLLARHVMLSIVPLRSSVAVKMSWHQSCDRVRRQSLRGPLCAGEAELRSGRAGQVPYPRDQ